MKSVAILGGSFNPFHNGHAAMVEAAITQLNVDEIWLMPAKQPPHKPSYGNVTDNDRISMLNAFAEYKTCLKVCDFELKMDGFTYTAKTLCELKKIYPDNKFYFLMGGDSFINFYKWYKPETIVRHSNIVICTREDCDKEVINNAINSLKESIGGEYILLNFKNVDVSSSNIREMISNNEDVSSYLPSEIYDYINNHSLYKGHKTQYSLEQLESKMKESLSLYRFTHVLGVKDTALRLADYYGCDSKKCAIAAILHDCAKELTPEQLKNLCDQNGVSYTKEEVSDDKTTLSLLHSKAGTILAKNLYYIDDKDILSAIFYHTVGKPDMSMIEKIIYVADYIEPGRTQSTIPALDEIRELSFNDIDFAVYLIAKNTVDYLEKNNRHVDNLTYETLKFYQRK